MEVPRTCGVCPLRRETDEQPSLAARFRSASEVSDTASDYERGIAQGMRLAAIVTEAEQPDTVPVPPKAERDGVWVERVEYDRLTALAAFGERTFQDFWNDAEPGDLSGADVQDTAIECGLLKQAHPPPEEAEVWYVPVYSMEGKKPVAEQIVPILKAEYDRMRTLCDAAVALAITEGKVGYDPNDHKPMLGSTENLQSILHARGELLRAAREFAKTKGGE